MIALFFLVLSIWLGLAIYEIAGIKERNTHIRIAAGILLGALFGSWAVYFPALFVGFGYFSIGIGSVVISSFLVWAVRFKNCALHTLLRVNEKEGRIGYALVFIFVIVMPFFLFGMWENGRGDVVYIGNYTDMPYHMAMVSAFCEQNLAIPMDPQSSGMRMSYHFMVNFHSAILRYGGFSLMGSVVIPQVLFAYSFCCMLHAALSGFLKSERIVLFAAILFLMGHIGFMNLAFALAGHSSINPPMVLDSARSVLDQMLFPLLNFLNPIINYFHPQRPFLFGFGMFLFVLWLLQSSETKKVSVERTVILISIILGLLPLFHIHTFLFLVPVFALWLLFQKPTGRLLVLSILLGSLSILSLVIIFTQKKASGFSGFDVQAQIGSLVSEFFPENVVFGRFIFWLRIAWTPLVIGGMGVLMLLWNRMRHGKKSVLLIKAKVFWIMGCVGVGCFIGINFYRMSPSWGDNNKMFLFFSLFLCVAGGVFVEKLITKGLFGKFLGFGLLGTGAVIPSLFEFCTIFSRDGSMMFSAAQRNVADYIHKNTDKGAIFLTSDDVIHFLPALAGRCVVDGSYTENTGFRKPGVAKDVRDAFRTGSPNIFEKYGVRYVMISDKERASYYCKKKAFKDYLRMYDQVHGTERFEIYDVTKSAQDEGLHVKYGQAVPEITGVTYLSDMEPVSVMQTCAKLEFDESMCHTPLVLNGIRYEKGLGSHSFSRVVFDIPIGIQRFVSFIGVDDSSDRTQGSVVFKVLVDGVVRYTSGVMVWNSQTECVAIPTDGGRSLELIIEDANDGDTFDHANWADARFE